MRFAEFTIIGKLATTLAIKTVKIKMGKISILFILRLLGRIYRFLAMTLALSNTTRQNIRN